MQIRNTGWAILVAVAAMWLCISGTAQAAKAAQAAPRTSVTAADKPIVLSKFTKRRSHAAKKSKFVQSRHARKEATKASVKVSAKMPAKTSAEMKVARQADSEAKSQPKAESRPELPPSFANARAELPRTNALAEDEARNIAAQDAKDLSRVDSVQVAAADQLNEGDRAAEAVTAPPAPAPPVASADTSPAQSAKIIKAVPSGERQVLQADDSDTWNKTSLIGKIFIAFGGLLTLASAARMLIA